jgi:effector-binding domain-containing protein
LVKKPGEDFIIIKKDKMEISIVNVESKQAVVIRDTCTAADLSKKYQELYGELSPIIKKQELKTVNGPFGIYHSFSPERVDVEAGIIVEGNPKPEGRMNIIQTYGGKAVCVKFYGPYSKLVDGWNELSSYMKEHNLQNTAPCYELYVGDPMETEDHSKLLTEIYCPI